MRSYILLFLTFLLFSCSNSENIISACNVENPLEDIAWLKQIKTNFKQSASATKKQIIQYTYNNETVFMIDVCNGCADNLTTVYNCEGNVICEFGGIAGLNTCPDFDKNSTNKIIIYEN
jgi:hypothetical protein